LERFNRTQTSQARISPVHRSRRLRLAAPIIAFLSLAPTASLAQTQAAGPAPALPTVVETFSQGDLSLVLGGQLAFGGEDPTWTRYVAEGSFVLENRSNARALTYNDIGWVAFPDSDTLSTTEDATISATVLSANEGHGGAGILIGSGLGGAYTAFTIDGQGRFHVLQKRDGKLKQLHTATHEAIRPGEANTVSFTTRRDALQLMANGVTVMQVPILPDTDLRRRDSSTTGIGLVAFGQGRFEIDTVEIRRVN
jgi:hypothetical protein